VNRRVRPGDSQGIDSSSAPGGGAGRGRDAGPERAALTLTVEQLDALLQAIGAGGYRLVGPTVRDGAIVYADVSGIADLPAGWTEVQEAGTYRLQRRADGALFGYALGPHAWKQLFFVPRLRLWQAEREAQAFTVNEERPAPQRLALIGARSCELHAIAIQDRVFLQGSCVDPDYAARRADTFVVAVNCAQAGGTCFCVSMQTGPRVTHGYDLVLTELIEGGHRFVVEIGSDRGAALLSGISTPLATSADRAAAEEVVARTARSMGRSLDTTGIKELLYGNLEHPRWDEVAARCLSCANCTLVCPTCFCSTVEDVTDLTGDHAERWRRWDSCFNLDFSYIHGGNGRTSTKARYRQWLTHKVASWIDQFGTSGCVGCGRCITWCPVGIDLTEEVGAIRAVPAKASTVP
jgi:sulfhydrogenase subunit beta (sulfur reductase)